jgi:hypothetical protein
MQKQILGILLMLSVLSCGNFSSPKLNLSDSAIEQTFSPEEIVGVNRIIWFMDSTAFAKCHCSKLDQAYSKLKYTPAIFNEPKFNALIAELKKDGLYQSFWIVRHRSDSVKSTNLEFNINGKLFKLIERLSDDNEAAREYYGFLMRDRDISPSLLAMFPQDFPELDVKRPAMRLLIATHLLFQRESENFDKKTPELIRLEDREND